MLILASLPVVAQPPCVAVFSKCPTDTILYDCDQMGDGLYMTAYPTTTAYLNGNCPAGTSLFFTQINGPTLPALIPPGTYLIGYMAFPEMGGQAVGPQIICNFHITIAPDNQPPVFQYCPPPITVNGTFDNNGNCTATGQWPIPIATDNCGGQTQQANLLESNIPCGSTLGAGTHTITYTAYDNAFNSATCSFTVTVLCSSGTDGPGAQPYALSVFPNPGSGMFTVEFPVEPEESMYFRVTDLTGQTLLEQQLEPGTLQQTVKGGTLPDGLYFLQVVSEGKILATEKIVKQ